MEKLWNNIALPDNFADSPSDPEHVPYLEKPPEVIDVTVGRQLFVDDFLIEETGLTPTYHTAKRFDGNPVMKADTPWETAPHTSRMACPFGSGVCYDPKDRLFKVWYVSDMQRSASYACSTDGIHWEKPDLGEVPGTNLILPYEGYEQGVRSRDIRYLRPDTLNVIYDPDAESDSRFKLLMTNPCVGPGTAFAGESADGVHFRNIRFTTKIGDASTFFYNPFRRKYVYSIRSYDEKDARTRDYRESDRFPEDCVWDESEQHFWQRCDRLDTPHPYIGFAPQLYKVNAQSYESLMLGAFQIFYGPENGDIAKWGVPKITEVIPMYSRDGYHFSRPCRDSLVNATFRRGDWDRGYINAAGGMAIIVGDELRLYYAAFAGDESRRDGSLAGYPDMNGMYTNAGMGFMTMRRDGFVSMDGKAALLTRLLEAHGKESLHINAKGFVQAELLAADGSLLASSAAFTGDSTNARLEFPGFDVRKLNDVPFRIRFTVDGELYAFGLADAHGDFGGKNEGYEVK